MEEENINKKMEQEPAKSIDELTEPVSKISDKELSTPLGAKILKANLQMASRENRELKNKINGLENQNSDLNIKVATYEERMGWKDMISIISAIILIIVSIIISSNLPVALVLIIIVIFMNLIKSNIISSILDLIKKKEKI